MREEEREKRYIKNNTYILTFPLKPTCIDFYGKIMKNSLFLDCEIYVYIYKILTKRRKVICGWLVKNVQEDRP